MASVDILWHETLPLLSLSVGFKNVELVIHSSRPLKQSKIPLRWSKTHHFMQSEKVYTIKKHGNRWATEVCRDKNPVATCVTAPGFFFFTQALIKPKSMEDSEPFYCHSLNWWAFENQAYSVHFDRIACWHLMSLPRKAVAQNTDGGTWWEGKWRSLA